MNIPDLSVVATLYRSSSFVDEFLERVRRAASLVASSYEVVLVDDGSPDDSLAKAIAHAREDPRLQVVELSRNFGHHAAILTGLAVSRGKRVFLIDSDLEEAPELLPTFARILEENDADVVYGVHDQKVGSQFRQTTSGWFWKLFNALSDTKTEENICHVRLMSRIYIDALLTLRERNIFLGGLYVWPGYRQIPVRIERTIRRAQSTYSLRHRLALLVRSIVAFSTRPLQIVFILGTGIAVLSGFVAVTFLVARLAMGSHMVSGFASLMISLWFLSGLTIMSLGVIGLYVAQVYIETKERPRTIIRRVHAFPLEGEKPLRT